MEQRRQHNRKESSRRITAALGAGAEFTQQKFGQFFRERNHPVIAISILRSRKQFDRLHIARTLCLSRFATLPKQSDSYEMKVPSTPTLVSSESSNAKTFDYC